jgi:RNA polymerase sigma factor (sigma-70 family)
MSNEMTDQELIARLAEDPVAFGVFYRRHVDRVIDFAARRLRDPADVADLTSNTFVAVLTGARSFDPERGEPIAWLIGIAAKQISNYKRRRLRESAARRRLAGRRHLDADDYTRLEERIDAARASEAMAPSLERLRPKAREALLLVSADGLTPAQAAEVLGISAAAFRMRLSAARKELVQINPTLKEAMP